MLQWRGRCASERSVQHYLQLGLAAAAMASLEPSCRAVVDSLASLASVMLNPLCNGLLDKPTHGREKIPHAQVHASQNTLVGGDSARERFLTSASRNAVPNADLTLAEKCWGDSASIESEESEHSGYACITVLMLTLAGV
eukprot:102237-Amphidinium_carterae.1